MSLQGNEALNETIGDIQSILDRLEMTQVNSVAKEQMNFSRGSNAGIGKELWEKKVNFDSKNDLILKI